MNEVSSASGQDTTNIHPQDLIQKLSNSQTDGCVQVSKDLCSYFIYFERGKLTYASHSIEPFERLERHLRRLSNEISALKSEVRTQVRLKFDNESDNNEKHNSDYQAICWLVEEKYLQPTEAATLVKRLTQEVLETFLLWSEVDGEKLLPQDSKLPVFCRFDLTEICQQCQEKIKAWEKLAPQILSPYQRPYFFSKAYAQQKISEQQRKKLGSLLRGFSFRQLAALLNQDELGIAKKLYPLIANGTILLREPQAPFDRLPNISVATNDAEEKNVEVQTNINLSDIENTPSSQKHWKIACVDDSPTILNEMNRFLEDDQFSVFTINDSMKALMQIIRIGPDLILLDVGMPNLDGYQLCTLLRKNSKFQTTPIVMVTGNKGLIDRAKARLAGATDYMTKPFNQDELLNMVFRYLS